MELLQYCAILGISLLPALIAFHFGFKRWSAYYDDKSRVNYFFRRLTSRMETDLNPAAGIMIGIGCILWIGMVWNFFE